MKMSMTITREAKVESEYSNGTLSDLQTPNASIVVSV